MKIEESVGGDTYGKNIEHTEIAGQAREQAQESRIEKALTESAAEAGRREEAKGKATPARRGRQSRAERLVRERTHSCSIVDYFR